MQSIIRLNRHLTGSNRNSGIRGAPAPFAQATAGVTTFNAMEKLKNSFDRMLASQDRMIGQIDAMQTSLDALTAIFNEGFRNIRRSLGDITEGSITSSCLESSMKEVLDSPLEEFLSSSSLVSNLDLDLDLVVNSEGESEKQVVRVSKQPTDLWKPSVEGVAAATDKSQVVQVEASLQVTMPETEPIDSVKLHELSQKFGANLSYKGALFEDENSNGFGFVEFELNEISAAAIDEFAQGYWELCFNGEGIKIKISVFFILVFDPGGIKLILEDKDLLRGMVCHD